MTKNILNSKVMQREPKSILSVGVGLRTEHKQSIFDWNLVT